MHVQPDVSLVHAVQDATSPDVSQEAPSMFVLYRLTFSSGKCYVGQTLRVLSKRIGQHRAASNRGSMLPVHCAWRLHGEPVVEELGRFDTHEALHLAEIDAIARLGSLCPGGYNVSVGGDTAPSKNPVVAAKIAASATGRKHADTTAWSDALRKQWQDPEYRAKILAGVKASLTDERRAQLSAAMFARWEKRRAEGWQVPESQRAKLRGRTFSDEARAKMSASARNRAARKQQQGQAQ